MSVVAQDPGINETVWSLNGVAFGKTLHSPWYFLMFVGLFALIAVMMSLSTRIDQLGIVSNRRVTAWSFMSAFNFSMLFLIGLMFTDFRAWMPITVLVAVWLSTFVSGKLHLRDNKRAGLHLAKQGPGTGAITALRHAAGGHPRLLRKKHWGRKNRKAGDADSDADDVEANDDEAMML